MKNGQKERSGFNSGALGILLFISGNIISLHLPFALIRTVLQGEIADMVRVGDLAQYSIDLYHSLIQLFPAASSMGY